MVHRELPWLYSSRSITVIDGRPWSLVVDCGHSWSTDRLYFTFFLTEQMMSNNLSMYDAIIHLLFFDNDIISHTNYIRLWPGQG